MSNTLTDLIPDIYEALDVVSREQVGFVMAASSDNSIERAAVGQTVRVPVYDTENATDITPGVTPPDDGDNTTGNVPVVLDYARRVPVRLTGEESTGLNHGPGVTNWRAGRFAQGFRKLANEMEASLAARRFGASRAVGTAGTTPFATDIRATADALKVLSDNGAPRDDMRIVLDSAAAANLRTLHQLTKANEAGTDDTLRTGALLDLHGFRIHESGAYAGLAHSAGDGSGYLLNGAASEGDTVLDLDTGSGEIKAGDTITLDGDPTRYVVASALAGGSVTIAAPGLRQGAADNTAVTVGESYTANVAFSRHAIHMASRTPELPEGGDMADDRQIVTDPFSGLSFELAVYRQYRQVQYEISCVWGSKVIKPEHVALILG